jgi:hypothetical protein
MAIARRKCRGVLRIGAIDMLKQPLIEKLLSMRLLGIAVGA